MRSSYFIGILLGISAIAALFLMEQLSAAIFIFIVEAIVIFGGVELLHHHMPTQLREARSDNCLRIDGSFSRRRYVQESRALNKVRMDLLAAFLLVALTGNWLVFFIHSEVIPFPIAFKAAEAFDSDPQTWKENLRNARVDNAFGEWSVSKVPADHITVASQQKLLWYAWPLVVFALGGWAVGSSIFIGRVYLTVIRSYATGVAARAEFNVNRDIARLQRTGLN